MKRNPRKKIPEHKFCAHVHPDDHPTRPGERCGSVKLKTSIFCYFHQPNQEKVRAQLAEAREIRTHPPNEKHGFYTKTHKECDKCGVAEACDFYEEGKKVCDFEVKKDIDLSSLQSIQDFAEELAKTEYQRYQKLTPFFNQNYENMELFDLSSRIAKRLMSLLKDYSAIKDSYEKRGKVRGWSEILGKD